MKVVDCCLAGWSRCTVVMERAEREFWTCWPTEELLMYEICRCSGLTPSSYSASKCSFVWPCTQMIAILGWFQAFRFITSVFLTEWLVNILSSNSNSAFKPIFFMKESVLLTTILSFLYHTFDIVISPWAGRIFITKKTVLNALYVVFMCET